MRVPPAKPPDSPSDGLDTMNKNMKRSSDDSEFVAIVRLSRLSEAEKHTNPSKSIACLKIIAWDSRYDSERILDKGMKNTGTEVLCRAVWLATKHRNHE